MLGALLLAGLFAAPISSFVMFLPVRVNWRPAGALAFSRRLLFALVGTIVLAAITVGLSELTGTTAFRAIVAAAVFVVFSLVLLPITRRWNGRAHVCWAACVFLYLAYLVFIIVWTFQSGLGVGGTIGGVVLWVLEVIAGVFAGAYLWELCDALGTEHWRRRVVEPTPAVAPGDHRPFVSLHVPAHNEPPEMVIETLQELCRQDYPNYEVIAIDDNTDDPELWQPVAAWCRENNVKFAHLSDWPGYKSGALNYALQNLTDPRAEVIGVVDSDYQIAPNFLSSCAPLFADPQVGFIQAPQDYRDWKQSAYYRRLYYSYKYFFAVSQPSRNEHDAAIFAGTMGLIRRETLEAVGGWDEWCITEDAELSLRVLRAGWSGLHVDQSFGHGVMPLTFEALKSQRYRWCFGGIQILRMYWKSLLRGRSEDGSANRLSLGQRWGYLAGGLQWYGDLLGVLFYFFLLAGAVNLALGGGQLFRKLTGFLVAAVPVLVILGLIRAVALLRRGTGASWKDAFGAFLIWQATALVVARASVQGLFAREAVFMRTPKTFDRAGVWQVIRANWAESLLAFLGLLGIAAGFANVTTLSGPLLIALLLIPTIGFAAAPFNSLAAQRAALPPDLTERRRTELSRGRVVARTAIGFGGVSVAAGAIAVVALLLTPDSGKVGTPHLVGPAPARAPHSASSGPTTQPRRPHRSGTPSRPGSTTPAPGTSTTPSTSTPASSTPSSPTSSTPTSSTPASSSSSAPGSSSSAASSSPSGRSPAARTNPPSVSSGASSSSAAAAASPTPSAGSSSS